MSFSFNKLTGHKPDLAMALTVTDKDVDKKIEELSLKEPLDKEGVLYNPETDRYEMKAELYKRAVRDGILYDILKEKTDSLVETYKPDTFWGCLKGDLIMFGLGILAGVGIITAF
jgi:hypothetical protein